jgi:hypothetical protein
LLRQTAVQASKRPLLKARLAGAAADMNPPDEA